MGAARAAGGGAPGGAPGPPPVGSPPGGRGPRGRRRAARGRLRPRDVGSPTGGPRRRVGAPPIRNRSLDAATDANHPEPRGHSRACGLLGGRACRGAASSSPFPPSPSPPAAGRGIRERCFPDLGDAALGVPDYDQFRPVVGSHCAGTNHQDITDVERVVFLGDSITQGTPPTPASGYYRNLLAESLRARFGEGLQVDEGATWGG